MVPGEKLPKLVPRPSLEGTLNSTCGQVSKLPRLCLGRMGIVESGVRAGFVHPRDLTSVCPCGSCHPCPLRLIPGRQVWGRTVTTVKQAPRGWGSSIGVQGYFLTLGRVCPSARARVSLGLHKPPGHSLASGGPPGLANPALSC